MKNKLPENISPLLMESTFDVAQTVDQLITYIAELTEVMEKKPCRHCELAQQQGVTHVHTPSPKEMLFKEIDRLPHRNGQSLIFKEEVQAIINRLMP